MPELMRGIKLFLLFALISSSSFGQEKKVKWMTTTQVIGSYYHLGSYSKETPLSGIEQLIELQPFEKFRFGLGSGFNLYPSTGTIPIFASFRFITPISRKWNFYVLQSYGRNIKTGDIGFNSNRYYGDVGGSYQLSDRLSLNAGMGYLMNWDRFGGKSLSFTGSIGLCLHFQ